MRRKIECIYYYGWVTALDNHHWGREVCAGDAGIIYSDGTIEFVPRPRDLKMRSCPQNMPYLGPYRTPCTGEHHGEE